MATATERPHSAVRSTACCTPPVGCVPSATGAVRAVRAERGAVCARACPGVSLTRTRRPRSGGEQDGWQEQVARAGATPSQVLQFCFRCSWRLGRGAHTLWVGRRCKAVRGLQRERSRAALCVLCMLYMLRQFASRGRRRVLARGVTAVPSARTAARDERRRGWTWLTEPGRRHLHTRTAASSDGNMHGTHACVRE